MDYLHLNFKVENSVAQISLNRPDVLNSFNKKMALEFQSALDTVKKSEEIRAVLISGTGRAFSSGQDLEEATPQGGKRVDLGNIVATQYNPIILGIREIEKPFVCAVGGIAAGAGANLALACDLVLASESAAFIQAFSKVGLIPDSGGTFLLPRLIGFSRATSLMMLGEKLSAQKAFEIGLIYKVCPDAQLQSEALEVAKKLALMPTTGLGLTKRALNRSFSQSLREQLLYEEELQRLAGNTEDYLEGLNAFFEKRPPRFIGR